MPVCAARGVACLLPACTLIPKRRRALQSCSLVLGCSMAARPTPLNLPLPWRPPPLQCGWAARCAPTRTKASRSCGGALRRLCPPQQRRTAAVLRWAGGAAGEAAGVAALGGPAGWSADDLAEAAGAPSCRIAPCRLHPTGAQQHVMPWLCPAPFFAGGLAAGPHALLPAHSERPRGVPVRAGRGGQVRCAMRSWCEFRPAAGA